jgi:hypothetical protein
MCDQISCSADETSCYNRANSDIHKCACDPQWMNFAKNMSSYQMDMGNIGNVAGSVPFAARGGYDGPRGIFGDAFQSLQWRTPTYESMPFLSTAALQPVNLPVIMTTVVPPGPTVPGTEVAKMPPSKMVEKMDDTDGKRSSMLDKFIKLLMFVLMVVLIIAIYRYIADRQQS